jgi:hypothetical protein
MTTMTQPDAIPAWLREHWPQFLRLVAITIAEQPPALRAAIDAALDAGDLSELEYAIDADRQVVIFGFASCALGEATFDAITGVATKGPRH